jgi:hypothetical protein
MDMDRVAPAAALSLVMFLPACASAQTSAMRPFTTLARHVPQVDAHGTRELRIQWTTAPPQAGSPSAPPANAFTLLDQRRLDGELRRERKPEISPNHLVVVVLDATARELDWRLVANPRVLRAEGPGPGGQLTGRVLEQGSAELLLTIPDVSGADRIQIYRPIWTGKEYRLEPLAQVSIGSGR